MNEHLSLIAANVKRPSQNVWDVDVHRNPGQQPNGTYLVTLVDVSLVADWTEAYSSRAE